MASRAAQATVPSQQTTSASLGSTVLAIRWVFPSSRGKLSLLQAPRLLLGRDDDSQIQLSGTETSRQHAEIRRDGLLPTIRDLASTNGGSEGGLRRSHLPDHMLRGLGAGLRTPTPVLLSSGTTPLVGTPAPPAGGNPRDRRERELAALRAALRVQGDDVTPGPEKVS